MPCMGRLRQHGVTAAELRGFPPLRCRGNRRDKFLSPATHSIPSVSIARIKAMRNETIAIHSGYEIDPTTKAVAVPIYQTVAYAFDSAEHGAALFNLEVEGNRYSRISNPTC